jgi:hypothetical protein
VDYFVMGAVVIGSFALAGILLLAILLVGLMVLADRQLAHVQPRAGSRGEPVQPELPGIALDNLGRPVPPGQAELELELESAARRPRTSAPSQAGRAPDAGLTPERVGRLYEGSGATRRAAAGVADAPAGKTRQCRPCAVTREFLARAFRPNL